MPINEPAARIGTPGKGKIQPAQGKHRAGVVAQADGNFSNNYEGHVNCRTATQIHYGEGQYQEYVNQPDMTPDDPDALVDGVHEYGYRDIEKD